MKEEMRNKILEFMLVSRFYSEPLWDDGFCATYRSFEKEPGLDIGKQFLRPHLIEMRNDGLVEISMATDVDGMPCGSGYILTQKGLALARELFPDEN